ncbi:MAG: phosphatase PAP2 family protein [Bacteroidota bacterium]|jgi:undecaprenyl-diphosphatase
MTESSDKPPQKRTNNPPEQKLGDTPVPPWEMPTPEEKQEAKPVRQALKKAVSKIDSQEKADDVIEKLETSAAGRTAADVQKTQPPVQTPAKAAEKVQSAARSGSDTERARKVIETTAKVLTAADKRPKEAVSEAVQEAINPEQQGAAPTVTNEREREYLQKAVLKRLKPLDALDAEIFLAINHLPHTRLLNGFFYSLTLAFQAVAPWYGEMGLAILRHGKHSRRIVRENVVPLLITSTLVELMIKPYFKRRRPFISIIQAIVIGKKPGSWSFPSGHAAGAFAGAWLLNQRSPKWSLPRYITAGLVAFSRIYLGDHYPGDVLSGSLSGLLFAMLFRGLARRLWK